jgi:uncharacterized protein (DUF433 family)
MLYVLRHIHNFSAPAIKLSLENLRKETKTKHPLFSKDIRIFANSLLLNKPLRGAREREVISLSNRQLTMGEITDVFSKRILQDERGEPLQVFPWRYFMEDNASRPVSIDPDVVSGRLVVTGTRIPVSVLLGMKKSNRTITEIAKNYSLDADSVEKALRHVEKPLQKVA